MDKCCHHQKSCIRGENEYYFFTWSIPEVSLIKNSCLNSEQYKMLNGYTYYASLNCTKDKIVFKIQSLASNLKCFVSMISGSKTLLSKGLNRFTSSYNTWYYYDLITLSTEDEHFQAFKQNPNDNLAFICRIIYRGSVSTGSVKTPGNTSTDSLYNLRSLAAVLRNSSELSLKEKVLLRVGQETESVSKAILCARSPVFSKMFENEMREVKENIVDIKDIEMPVLKAVISFLYTGKLKSCDFNSLCDIYYASDKYEILDLRQICGDLLIPQISMDNIYPVLKLAFSHDDMLLRSTVTALVATNIEAFLSTDDWKNLIDDEPKIAAKVLSFFDF